MSKLPIVERAELERLAVEWANLFQRSSSCVEGRNGQLSLCHHSLHRLRPQCLAALTVLANYFHRRRDGSTAAERFFGVPPSDLFEWLVSHVSSPPRPAARRQSARISNAKIKTALENAPGGDAEVSPPADTVHYCRDPARPIRRSRPIAVARIRPSLPRLAL